MATADLLIIDINGVLLDRVPIGDGPVPGKSPLLTVASTDVYLRPHAAEFVAWALERFHVAVWTSARATNANAMLRALIGEPCMRRLEFVWCQDRCTTVTTVGQKKPLFQKDIRRVREAWSNVNRIVVVDDSPEKFTHDMLAGAWLAAPTDLAPTGTLRAELEARLANRAGNWVSSQPCKKPSQLQKAAATADGRLRYEEVVCGRSLAAWVQVAHDALVRASGWEPVPLRPGMFGFDNLVSSVAALLDSAGDHGGFVDLDTAATAVHAGWAANYVYWRDHAPYAAKNSGSRYTRPSKPLGDERRDACAAAAYADLSDAEKEKDRVIARAVMGTLFEH